MGAAHCPPAAVQQGAPTNGQVTRRMLLMLMAGAAWIRSRHTALPQERYSM